MNTKSRVAPVDLRICVASSWFLGSICRYVYIYILYIFIFIFIVYTHAYIGMFWTLVRWYDCILCVIDQLYMLVIVMIPQDIYIYIYIYTVYSSHNLRWFSTSHRAGIGLTRSDLVLEALEHVRAKLVMVIDSFLCSLSFFSTGHWMYIYIYIYIYRYTSDCSERAR